jgi:Tol biopolymer transport system component
MGGISNPDIVVVDGPSAKPRKLVAGVSPAWSPDGEKIAYCVHEGNGFGQIQVINADGSGKAQITKIRGGGCDPQWSPDGERLVFTALGFSPPKLVGIAKNGEGMAAVTDGYGAHWSPDGKQLAFCRTEGRATTAIMVVTSDGTGLRKLTEDNSEIVEVGWMPDGLAVVFSSQRDHEHSAIYRINVDGSGLGVLAEDKKLRLYFPVPSPDGKQLVVDTFNKGSSDSSIVLLSLGAGQQTVLARGLHPAIVWNKRQ